MPDYLFEVRISRGKAHPEWSVFHENVTRLNAKSNGFGGIDAVCVIKHHTDEQTVQIITSERMNNDDDVTVSEITRDSLGGNHAIWVNLVENYFLPHGSYPNL